MHPHNTRTSSAGRRLCYRFDDVVVDSQAYTVHRAGVLQTVEPKAYAVLLELVQHPNAVVSRGELLDAVWGHRHVTPGVLTRAIAQLRHALGDDPHAPRYIRTRHALGYCFIGELRDARSNQLQAGVAAAGAVSNTRASGAAAPLFPDGQRATDGSVAAGDVRRKSVGRRRSDIAMADSASDARLARMQR